jgi:WD40 repeat protein
LKLHGREVRTVAIAPDGKRLATAGRDGIVGLWELPSGRLIQRIEADPRDTYTVAFVDRQVFASAGEGRKIRFWSAADGAPLHEIPIGGSVPFDLAFSGDGTRMAVALGYAGWGLWEGRGFRSLKERYRRPFDKGGAMALTLREDGAVTVYSYMDDTVSLWDAAEGQERSVLKPPPSLTCFAHVPGGRSLVVGTKEGEVRVWQPGGALGPPLLRGRGGVQCLAVSADGGTILSGCNETPGRVHLWRLALGEEDMLETGDGNAVRSLAISPDDRLVVSGSTGEHGAAVVLWDVVDPSPDR